MAVAGDSPNVILIMADQLRADALSFMGNSVVRTPNLDRLASRGVLFEQAFTNCPVSMASRGAIHTGRYPRAIRMRSMGILPPEEVTMAETFRRAGYRTGMFGKLHFTPMAYTLHTLGTDYELDDVTPFLAPAGVLSEATKAAVADPMKRNYGFQTRFPVADSTWGHYLDWLAEVSPETIKHHVAENWGRQRDGVKYGSSPPATRVFPEYTSDFFDSHVPAELHPSYFIVEKTIEFVRANRDRPFFAHCSFVDPHHPFNAPSPYSRMYSPEEMPTPPELDRQRCYPPGLPRGVMEAIRRRATYPDELFRWARANYYGMVSHIDWCVGRLAAALEEAGLAEDTIIVFTSDHGEYVGDHRLMYKGSLLFDGLMRIPLLFTRGSRLAHRRIEGMVQEIDIYPTVMSLAGLPVHAGVQGRDLGPAMRGEPLAGCEYIACELDDLPDRQYASACAVRTRDRKLVYYPVARTGMLFDLAEDPGETRNLYDEPGSSARLREMMSLMLDYYHTSKDPLPVRLSQA